MKKILLLVLGVMLVGSLAFGQTQVLSRNAVGYVKVDARSNGFTLVSIPFNAFSNTAQGIFGAQLVGGTPGASDQVLFWDKAGQQYVTLYKDNSGIWRDANTFAVATNIIVPGDGFWIRNRRTTNQTVYLMGEVPDKLTMPTNAIAGVVGFNIIAYTYPTEALFTNLLLFSVANKGTPGAADQVLFWNKETQSYSTYYASTTGWRDANTFALVSNLVVYPADGFWFRRRGAVGFTWTETKPYTWP